MRIQQALFLVVLISFLGGAGWFVRKLIYIRPAQSVQMAQCSVIMWNKTDQDITLIVRPHRASAQYVDVPVSARACVVLENKKRTLEKPEYLKYVGIVYAGKKYRFYEKEIINHYFDVENTNRYLACMIVDEADTHWEQLRSRVKIKLDDDSRYMVVSNYPKLNLPWDTQAHLAAVKIKTPRAAGY